MKSFYKICIIILTYGNRKFLLEQVVDSILRQTYPFSKIIIVDNAAEKKTGEFINNIAQANSKISIIHLCENTGSAGGYKVGLIEACKITCDFIWMLDDDNMPEDNALEELICAWDALNITGLNTMTALLSLRIDREQYVKTAQGGSIQKNFGRQNSFLGFHFFDLPGKFIGKINAFLLKDKTNRVRHINMRNVNVPYGPYGGLFLYKSIINYIEFPDEGFFLYSDDHDFTYRITKLGGKIMLIPSSKIKDIDKSWDMERKTKISLLPSFMKNGSKKDMFRIYYSIRNRVYFEKNNFAENIFLYLLNVFIYSFIISLVSFLGVVILFKSQFARILLEYFASVKDGLFGKLGKRKNWELNDN